jgi:hypothetical protein
VQEREETEWKHVRLRHSQTTGDEHASTNEVDVPSFNSHEYMSILRHAHQSFNDTLHHISHASKSCNPYRHKDIVEIGDLTNANAHTDIKSGYTWARRALFRNSTAPVCQQHINTSVKAWAVRKLRVSVSTNAYTRQNVQTI